MVARQPRLVATYGGAGAAVARKSRPPRRRLIPNNSHTLERVLTTYPGRSTSKPSDPLNALTSPHTGEWL